MVACPTDPCFLRAHGGWFPFPTLWEGLSLKSHTAKSYQGQPLSARKALAAVVHCRGTPEQRQGARMATLWVIRVGGNSIACLHIPSSVSVLTRSRLLTWHTKRFYNECLYCTAKLLKKIACLKILLQRGRGERSLQYFFPYLECIWLYYPSPFCNKKKQNFSQLFFTINCSCFRLIPLCYLKSTYLL